MDFLDLGFSLTVAYDDLSDVWPLICKDLHERLPLRNVNLTNKLGATVAVDEVPVRLLPANHASLQRLQPHPNSAVVWFRQPAVVLVCISCDDAEDFKRNFRLQLRAMVDPETRHPLSPEPVFIYVPPQGLDPDAKGPGRVIDAMRRELGSRRRERVARLNPPEPSSSGRPGSPAQGADDVIGCIKEALRASLEARAAAYTEELRRHLGAVSGPQAPAFAELFLLKDSLAVMMEASGLLQDALREYLELDVAFQQAMTASGSANQTEMQLLLPGGSADEAAPMWTTWQHTRHAVLGTAAADASSQLAIRQSLFANEARVLLKLQRHAEVLDRGLTLVEHMASGRTQQTTLQQQHQGRSSRARECWAFAGCISLASVVSTLHAQEAPGGGVHQTPFAASSGAVRSILLPDAGMEGGDGAVHPDFDASEHRSWKLGVLPSDQSMAHTLANGVDRTDAQHVYCLLGQLYCLARELLEAIGAAAGFHPPRFAPSLEAAASCAAGALLHKAEGGAARVVESPRRSRARSLSPSRTSLDRTTLSRSMMSSGVVNGVESGDEGSSLSIHPVRSSLGAGDERLAILDQMQTIDLTAAQAREQHESTAGETEVAAGTSSGAGGPREGQDENGSSAATGTELSLAPETSAALPSMLSTASSSATAGPDQPDLHSPGRLAQQGPETAPAGTERKAEMAPAGPTTVSVHSRKFSEAGSTVSTPRSSTTGPPADSDAGLSPDPSKELGRVPSGGAAASLAEVEAYISGAGGAHRRSTSHNTTRSLNGGETVAGGEGSGAWQGRVHWRIRAALSSQASFTGLWTALSHAAAECFEHGGRRRRALLCHADAADALASQGKFTEAAAIYEAQCRVALREGWLPVALQTLPKLAACQVEVAAPTGLPHTAVALLTLLVNPKKGQSSSQDSAALRSALSLLTSAAALAGAGNNLEYPPLLGPTVSFHGVDLSSILLASPVKGWYCRFYGRSDAAGHPILVPTGPGGAAKARVQLAVGDVAPLVIHVTNPLPAAVQLADLRLVLSGMRQMAALASPRAASSPAFRPTMQTLPLTTRTSLGTAPSLTPRSGAFAPIGTPLSTGTGAASGSQALAAPAIRMHSFAEEADEPQYVSEWQETEELHCVLAHCEPLPGVGTFPEGNVAPGVATSLKGRPVIAPVELQPGVSQLTFLAAPVKRGVYKPVRITGLLGQLPVSLKVSLPPDLDGTAANGTATAHEDAVVLQVEGPAPRVSLAAVAAGGACLVAGQRQWLGFHVTPGRDTLESSSLAVTWPLPPGVADIARKVTGLLGLQAPPPALNAADISLATSGGAGAPGAGAPQSPVLLPQHAAAVVSGLGDEAASKSVLVCANSDSGDGAPAWIDGGCEEISIPEKCSARGAATAWWWVDVGPFAGAPEQVQVAAPGAMGVGSSWAPQEGHPHAGPEAGMGPAVAAPAMLDISVALQYVSGCRRTYTRVLSVPVQQPFAVHTTAQELPSGRIILHFMLTSRLPHAIAITAATMAPQPGLLLLTSAADQLGLLPLNLPAYGQVSLSFQMGIDKAMACGDRASAQARLQQASKLQPSALTVSYEMDEVQVCGANIAPQDSTHSRQSAHGGAGGDRVTMGRSATLAALAEAASAAARAASHGLRLPSAESLTALRHRGNRGNNAQSQEPPEPTVQSCSFTHQCALELSSLDAELPGAVVLVQLLGPFSAVAGQPISFYWRLERAGLPTDAEQSAGDKEPAPVEGPSKMQFEIFAEGDAWRPLGRRTGTVVLDAEDGSLATVEATLVPLVGGTVPVPLLRLQDVAYQEVFDVGTSGTNYVVVTPQ